MAFICCKQNRECDGCGACLIDNEFFKCPVCRAKLYCGDALYRNNNGDIAGCEHCLNMEFISDDLFESE